MKVGGCLRPPLHSVEAESADGCAVALGPTWVWLWERLIDALSQPQILPVLVHHGAAFTQSAVVGTDGAPSLQTASLPEPSGSTYLPTPRRAVSST